MTQIAHHARKLLGFARLRLPLRLLQIMETRRLFQGVARTAVLCLMLASLFAGCGNNGNDGSSDITEDQIAAALDLRFEGADNLYRSSKGNCIVVQALTSSDEVQQAKDTGALDEAVATNPDGTAGVVFGGFTSVDPDVCAADAEADLANLTP